jgi:hypothetical protein
MRDLSTDLRHGTASRPIPMGNPVHLLQQERQIDQSIDVRCERQIVDELEKQLLERVTPSNQLFADEFGNFPRLLNCS